MEKLWAMLQVLQKGQEVANAAKVKNLQMMGTALTGLILLGVKVAAMNDIAIPISEGDAVALGAGFVVVYNVVLTMATSKKVGIGGSVPDDGKANG